VQLQEKNKFKASSYLEEINKRETELRESRDKLLDMEEEQRKMSVNQEKLKSEKDYLISEMKQQQADFNALQSKFNDQARLLQSVCSHSKNAAISGLNYLNNEMNLDGGQRSNETRASEEAQRADRIAK
jgi:chlorite dismutase